MRKVKRKKKSKSLKYLVIVLLLFAFIALLILASYTPPQDTQNQTDFALTDINGQNFRLSDFRGKIVILDFMATWCGPCRGETTILTGIWHKYGEQIVIISIDIDPRESNEDLRTFSKDFPEATWIWALDSSNLAQTYQITAIPTLTVIDKDGKKVSRHVGLSEPSALIREIDELIK